MERIAAILTCHNRKELTVACLESLFKSLKRSPLPIYLSVYLTDDGSTDGTAEAVLSKFPAVKFLRGNGTLYWAGGMRKSWNTALKGNYDGYLLLNDDTCVFQNVFEELLNSNKLSLEKYGKYGIYIGSTKDPLTGQLTYGGAVLQNKFLYKYKKIKPNGFLQACDLGNANIMLVPKEVVQSIGILNERFRHSIADYDYTLRAKEQYFPVLIVPNYCGTCVNDHKDKYDLFVRMPIKKRLKFLNSPVGFAFNDHLKYTQKHFPIRLLFVFFSGWFKVVFPKLYLLLRYHGYTH